MSELMNATQRRLVRWRLLSTASALALMVAAGTTDQAKADDTDNRPTVWIELGAQMQHVSGQGEAFEPAFLAANPASPVLQPMTPLQAQKPSPFDFGGEGKISLQPKDSDWVFSAAVRMGRSSSAKDVSHQTKGVHQVTKSGAPFGSHVFATEDFAETQNHFREEHATLDFSAGRDVGLGMFGNEASSILGFGVRFAQFTSDAALDIRARPDLGAKYFTQGPFRVPLLHFHTYHDVGTASRSFHGVGPSLSWTASAPFAGNAQDGELTFDWGANAALLFGRQRARVRHQETGNYHTAAAHYINGDNYTLVYQHSGGHDTDRTVTVSNVGGSVGLSWRVQSFKASLGYRADFFFGAMDTGIDVRKSATLGFKGLYASISLGLGG